MERVKLDELQIFVDICRSDPSILNHPSLGFFRSFLQSLGAHIPAASEQDKGSEETVDDIIIESDLELDETDVVEPDNDPPQKMGDPSLEATDESRDAAQLLKSNAMKSLFNGELQEAIDSLTEAILLYPSSAILYATRASVFVKLKKPKAAIRDASAALQINSDSAKGYKVRGMARAMLGLWEEAARDLHVASNLDYDDEIGSVLRKVEPNVQKIEVHRRKYERLLKERELKKIEQERLQRRAQAQAEYERDKKMEHTSESRTSDHVDSSAPMDGQVIGIYSTSELETRMNAASKTSQLVILYFTAEWCGPCRFVSPLYTSLAGKYSKAVFLKVDIDKARDVAAKWNISSVPSFFFVKKGKEVDKLIGADKVALERKIAQYAN